MLVGAEDLAVGWVLLDELIVEPRVRGLCVKPYPGARRGCPNYGRKRGCPPAAPFAHDVFDLDRGLPYALVNEYDLDARAAELLAAHPGWTAKQARCSRYWQATARKQLEQIIARFRPLHPGYAVERCPEALGVNVTATLARAGVVLEWPPEHVARQIAIAAPTRGSNESELSR